MSTQLKPLNLTVSEYLQLELKSEIRHEYIAGEVYAMAGASEEHDLICGNIYVKLHQHLQGSGCRVFSSNMKVKIEELDIFYYPDISVTCDSQDREKYFKKYPCLLVEVLSAATKRIDRHEKLVNYSEINSLQEYVLVSQDRIKVDIYRKDESGNWNLTSLGETDVLNLESVGLKMTVAEIYEDVDI
ncbi:MAG: Uma2 family endonuclease [Okeania sp. SIO2H7]|nr:Uma2 family endonuclease [Okeania sp. SIO2H7]